MQAVSLTAPPVVNDAAGTMVTSAVQVLLSTAIQPESQPVIFMPGHRCLHERARSGQSPRKSCYNYMYRLLTVHRVS